MCVICDQNYSSFLELSLHFNEMHIYEESQKSHGSTNVSNIVPSLSNSQANIQNVSRSPRPCDDKFRQEETLGRHPSSHIEQPLLCTECGFTTFTTNEDKTCASSSEMKSDIKNLSLGTEIIYEFEQLGSISERETVNNCEQTSLILKSEIAKYSEQNRISSEIENVNYHGLPPSQDPHTGEKQLLEQNVSKDVSKGTNLKSHSYTHTGENPFTDQFTYTDIIKNSELKIHSFNKTGEFQFSEQHISIDIHVGAEPASIETIEDAELKSHPFIHTGENRSLEQFVSIDDNDVIETESYSHSQPPSMAYECIIGNSSSELPTEYQNIIFADETTSINDGTTDQSHLGVNSLSMQSSPGLLYQGEESFNLATATHSLPSAGKMMPGHSYTIDPSKNNISFMCLNVRGIRSRLDNDDFTNQLNNYDILSFCETITDDADTEFLTSRFSDLGFNIFIQNRKNLAVRRSGGILVAVRRELCRYVKRLNCSADFIIVLDLDKGLFNFNKNVIYITAYIPPAGSRYSNVELFSSLSNVILDYDADDYLHMLAGDLNAHTRSDSDLVTFDKQILEMLDLDDDIRARLDIIETMDILGLPIMRSSMDVSDDSSNYGKALLELCKNHMLCIFNGRAGEDRNIGKLTTKGKTLLDYVIGSPLLLSKVRIFKVHSFDPLFSDYHCRVEWQLNSDKDSTKTTKSNTNELPEDQQPPIFWDPNKAGSFLENLDKDKITHLIENFEDMTINQISNNLKTIMKNSAELSFAKFRPKLNVNKLSCYNKETQRKRKEYYKARKKHNKLGCQESLDILIAKSDAARKAVTQARALSQNKFIDKLRILKNGNSKLFWKLIKGNKKEKISIPLELFKTHFMELAVESTNTPTFNLDQDENLGDLDTTVLNRPFNGDEIMKFVKDLKNNKAAGIDEIINEFIKCSIEFMLPLYIKLFNRVLDTGEIPDDWLTGMIIPIYKNKGSKEDTNNYRGITLLSCVGKLFTSILNQRLTEFCDNNLILKEIQAGFRKGYSTLDNIYVFKNIIELFRFKKKKLFCCFVDYKKAFDSVWREALWYKLTKAGIQGKIFNVIKSLYAQVKSCVFLNGKKSDFFISARGVRQGENLSPLLFSLFVNDIEEEFINSGCKYIELNDAQLDNFIRLLILMYADDTIILADSESNMQTALHSLQLYCEKWKLEINCTKTKISIFSRGKTNPNRYNFLYSGRKIEIVDSYKYLGIEFTSTGSFKSTIESLKQQASRAMFALISKSRRHNLPVDIQLQLFDSTVMSIMLYGCEIWGNANVDVLDKLYLKYLKMILGVQGKTCNNMVYGELGRFPLGIHIKKRAVGFWGRLVTNKDTKISRVTYSNIRRLSDINYYKCKWIDFIKGILQDCDLINIWQTHHFQSVDWLKITVGKKLKDNFIAQWKHELGNMTSCDVYVHYKQNFKLEEYLIHLPTTLKRAVCALRTNNSRLPKVVGRYTNTPRDLRFCTLCPNENLIGDEYHILLECKNQIIESLRSKYISVTHTRNPSMQNCINLLGSDDKSELRRLGYFLKKALPLFR